MRGGVASRSGPSIPNDQSVPGHGLLKSLLGLFVAVAPLAHGLGHLERDHREVLLEEPPPVQPGQHDGGQGEQVEEEEAVNPVADPGHGNEGSHGASKVHHGLLLPGLAARSPALLHGGKQRHHLGACNVELLLLLTGPAVRLEDLAKDLGADEVAERQAEPQEGDESDKSGVPVPIKDELEGEDTGCYGWVEILLPAE